LKDIQSRNKIEVDEYITFVKDYISLQKELAQTKRDYLKTKGEL